MKHSKTITTLTLAAIILAATSLFTGPRHFDGIDLAATGCAWTALLMWLHTATTGRQATNHQ